MRHTYNFINLKVIDHVICTSYIFIQIGDLVNNCPVFALYQYNKDLTGNVLKSIYIGVTTAGNGPNTGSGQTFSGFIVYSIPSCASQPIS